MDFLRLLHLRGPRKLLRILRPLSRALFNGVFIVAQFPVIFHGIPAIAAAQNDLPVNVCPRLEGILFAPCAAGGGQPGVPAVNCTKSCSDLSSNYLTCEPFRACGASCSGSRQPACPDASSYCGNTTGECGISCTGGTKVPTCSGSCFIPKTKQINVSSMSGGGCTSESTGVCEQEQCTTTEAGRTCTCLRQGTRETCTQPTCVTGTESCVTGYDTVPNEVRGCNCLCPGSSSPPPTGSCQDRIGC